MSWQTERMVCSRKCFSDHLWSQVWVVFSTTAILVNICRNLRNGFMWIRGTELIDDFHIQLLTREIWERKRFEKTIWASSTHIHSQKKHIVWCAHSCKFLGQGRGLQAALGSFRQQFVVALKNTKPWYWSLQGYNSWAYIGLGYVGVLFILHGSQLNHARFIRPWRPLYACPVVSGLYNLKKKL